MDEKNLTIGDIALALGVSKTTVSRAISGKGRIGEETRRRVQAYIDEHNYRPNVIAKGLAQNRTFNLGLVLPGDYSVSELPFFQGCMVGISRVASAMDYDVLITMVTAEDLTQLQRVVTNHKIDGMILTRTLVKDAAMDYLKEMEIPFVVLGSTSDREALQVDNDHRSACRELVSGILDAGARRIALIGGDESHVVTQNRLQGFEDAFRGINGWKGEKKVFLNVRNAKEAGEIVEKLLEDGTDCIVAMDDLLCSNVLNTLQQMQIAVPEQVQVASFYDSAFLAGYQPSITSIRFDVEELGGRACELLLRLIDGEETEKRTLLGYEIRRRRSTL